jgi:flagellar motor switch protein FliM
MSEDTPAFDQADIDALFGDVGGAAVPARRNGIRALIETDVADHQRLPMLEVVCDRMLRSFATSMRALTTDPMEVSLAGVSGGRFGDLMNRAALPAMFGVFRIEPWNSHGVITIEPGLIYAAVDALLGGRQGSGSPPRVEGRAFTTIETSLVGRLLEQVLSDFSSAFAQVAPITARLERIETSPRFAFIVGPSIVTAHCQFRIDMEGRGGRFGLLLPTTSLEPVREQLTLRFAGERSGTQDSWAAPIEEAVRALHLPLRAVVGRRVMTLEALQALGPGDHLAFDPEPDAPAALVHDGMILARAQLGRRSGRAALRLQAGIAREQRA